METLLTVQEAAEFTRLKPKTLYAYAERKTIPHVKLGSRLLFSQEDLEEWILGNKVESVNVPGYDLI